MGKTVLAVPLGREGPQALLGEISGRIANLSLLFVR
jgi:hypothetical protein